jgi:membrane protease YdiL (CAAX protease family)
MDFNVKNPLHWFALLLIVGTLLVFVFFPVLTYLGFFGTDITGQIPNFTESFQVFFEIFTLVLQGVLVIFLLIIFPFLWYNIVNKYSWKKMLSAIKLRTDNLDMAFLWGLITAIVAFGVVIAIGMVLTVAGVDVENASNIRDLEALFSIPSMLILITLQPIAEEFFFRGFLLDKISKTAGVIPAIILSSALFGIAHLSYGNIYPAVLTGCIGVILAVLVVRTKNLTAAVIAHILFNLTSFTIYVIGSDLFV